MSGRRGLLIIVATVVPLLLLGQSNTTTGQSGSSESGAFCSRWEEARAALLDETVEKRDEGLQSFDEAAEQQLEILDSTDPLVPPEIRAEWDAAAGFRRAVTDLLFTVDPVRVRPIHLELAFGDADPESLEADAMAAVAAIDEWTVTGCGDFCDRWPEIDQAIRVDEQDLFSGGTELLAERDRGDMRLLASIDPLVPEELSAAWDELLEWRSRIADALVENPGDPWQYFEGPDANLDTYLDELGRLIEPVAAWAGVNCDTATRSNAPGTLNVLLQLTDDSLGSTVVVAVVEPGSPITSLESNAALLGGNCLAVNEPPSTRPFEALVIEPRGTSRLCDFVFDEGGPESAQLDAGTYDVVVLTVNGLSEGDLNRFIPPPERCVRFPVVIGGDTDVDAPPLEPCDLGPIAGDPADAAVLRAPVVDPNDPGAGTLTVVFPDAISPTIRPDVDVSSQEASGSFLAVALPSGTTLDEVGRREVWPSGAVCIESITAEFAATRDDEDEAKRARSVPLLVLPPTGFPPVCLQAWASASDDRFARGGVYEPVTLARGIYDLYLEANPHGLGAIGPDSDGRRCFRQEVEIDGDVEITVPPATDWGSCQ